MNAKTPRPTDSSRNPPARKARATLTALASNADTGLSAAEARARLARDGPNEVSEPKGHPVRRFAARFWNLSAWMLELIGGLSALLHKWADAGIAIALLIVNAALGFAQEERAAAAVAALRRQLQVTARVLRDGQWAPWPARDLVVGDVVRVRGGDLAPADVQLIRGALRVDQSALTGESTEVDRAANDVLYAGAVVRRGEATGVVVATAARTYFGRTTQLVATARPRLHVEAVITRVVRWLFAVVGVLVAVALTGVVFTARERLIEMLPLSLVLLMSAVPVALPVMFTVSMALGSLELGRRGVLVTRLSAAEDAATMDVLCADKTGTLTQNRLSFRGAVAEPGFTEDDVLACGALASNDADQDPIDVAFLRAARERRLIPPAVRVLTFTPFTPALRRTEAVVEVGGQRARLVKGALRVVAAAAGASPAALDALEARASAEAQHGVRILAVARAEGEHAALRLVGLAMLHDPPRPDARALIEQLRELGVAVKMLTGDALAVARAVGGDLGLRVIVRAPELRTAAASGDAAAGVLVRDTDGFAEVFPEDKFIVVERLQAAGHVVGMTGDGVNDAPALRQAEVGVAVRGATDVAKRAASVVLTTEGLASIVDLVRVGRGVYQRVLTWIVNKVSRTIFKAGFVVLAFLATGRFVISALGMVLLVFLTDFAKITLATDRVRPSARPETWDIAPLVRVGAALGVAMLAEALGLLAFGWDRLGLAHDAGRLGTFTFQTLLFFALFSIVSIRERLAFWASRPSTTLCAALAADGAIGLAVGAFGIGELRPLPLAHSALVAGYAAVCSLGVNDLIKRALLGHTSRE